MMKTIQDKILLKQTELNLENDPQKKQELQKQLRRLQLEKEIEDINKRIQQLR
jgi:hypothetical protein